MAANFRIATVVAVIVLVSWIFAGESRAQVTFSRDWNPGKRVVIDMTPEQHVLKSASTLCHLLLNQIHLIQVSDNNREDIDPGNMFNAHK